MTGVIVCFFHDRHVVFVLARNGRQLLRKRGMTRSRTLICLTLCGQGSVEKSPGLLKLVFRLLNHGKDHGPCDGWGIESVSCFKSLGSDKLEWNIEDGK